MKLPDQPSADRQPQPESLLSVSFMILDLKEFIEQPIHVFRGDTNSGINHMDFDILVRRLNFDPN